MAMATSRSGLLFTACREAIVLVAYPDGKHLSIGIGSNSPDLKEGDSITIEQVFDRFKADIAAREAIVNRALKVEVSQQIFDCLVDFYYQNGNKPDDEGRPGFITLMKLINAGAFKDAAEYLPTCWRNSHGETIKGLKDRRYLEQAVFLRGDYGDLTSAPFYPGNPHTTKQQRYVFKPEDLA